VALPLTFFLHPVHDPAVLIAGFLLFQLFDIVKPPPVRQLEQLPAGWGIMADDLAAGVYANLSLCLLTQLDLFTWIATLRS
jgi:phosphatidylglycerophosphatase A